MKTCETMTKREQIGQHFAIGFDGTEMTEVFKAFLKEYKIGNIILFSRNISDNKQLKKLCADLRKHIYENIGIYPLITIDQEGGTVIRLAEDASNVPGEMAIAATGDIANAYKAGKITGRELREVGINVDLAPVMDVNSNIHNALIGVRAYSDNPKTVAAFGCQMIKGLQDEHVLACAKHFPGHGDTAEDSHLSLPCVNKSKDELLKTEFYPFKKAIEADVAAIMSTHILFPQLEEEKIPATMSRKILTDLLRKEFGFDGIIFSDCLEMNAIKDYYGTAKGAVSALGAGVDIVLVSHTLSAVREAYQCVEKALEEGTLTEEELKKSTQRILRYKEMLDEASPTDEYYPEENQKEVKKLLQKSITLVSKEKKELPKLGEHPFFVGSLRYRTSFANSEVADNFSFPEEMQKNFGGEAFVISNNPEPQEIAAVVSKAQGHSCIVLGTFYADSRKEQLTLCKELEQLGIPMIVVALGTPYDFLHIPDHIAGLCAWEYSKRNMQILADVLSGRQKPEGILPISMYI